MTVLLTTVGIVLFVLGVLISVALHEMGHMLPAKAFGMKVTQFFVGFGRTVWSTRRGETEYGIKAIPAGGFVRIIGMLPPGKGQDPTKVRKANTGPIQSLVENARSAEYETISPEDDGRLFYQKVWWKKLIVMASDSAAVLNDIAWYYATAPDSGLRNGNEAVRLAEQASALTSRAPLMLATLAAAYAENARISDALKTAEEARLGARSSGDGDTLKLTEKLLASFRAGQPFRDLSGQK